MLTRCPTLFFHTNLNVSNVQKVVLDTLTVFRLFSSLLFFPFSYFFGLKIYNTLSTSFDVSDCSFGREEPITANFHQTHRYILFLMFEILFNSVFFTHWKSFGPHSSLHLSVFLFSLYYIFFDLEKKYSQSKITKKWEKIWN